MALLHQASPSCSLSQTNFFELPPTQLAIEKSYITTINPVTSVNSTNSASTQPIDFRVTSSSELFVDPSKIDLYLKGRILPKDNADFEATDEVYPINTILHTLFKSVEVSLNNVAISNSQGDYSIRAFLEKLLSFNRDSKSTVLGSEGFHVPEGLEYHKSNFKKTKDLSFEMMGGLHVDLCMQDKLLLTNVDIDIRLIRNDPKFYLQCSNQTAAKDPYIQIDEIMLYVTRVKLSAPVFIDLQKQLMSERALYPIKRVETRKLNLIKGLQNYDIQNLIIGTLPTRIIIGVMSHEDAVGNYNTTPLAFKHFNLSSLALYNHGVEIQKGFRCNFDKKPAQCVRAFRSVFELIGDSLTTGNGISLKSYVENDCVLYGFDLTNDLSSCSPGYLNVSERGDVALKVSFSTNTTQSLNLLLYMEYNNIIEIDNLGRVTHDF